ncbi:hypothetical protein OHB93_07765 [Microbacterium sp. No. 7]|uniref:hypothetical protein n=1 Tax=Microbacterium sp. No. 7 TaxID=1714373 RepID=UPI00300A68E0
MTDIPTAAFDDLEPAVAAGPAASAPSAPSGEGPRTRWAAVVWGLTFAALAAAGYAATSTTGSMRILVDTVAGADVGPAVAVGLLIIGGLVSVAGIAGLLRGGQRRVARRPKHQTPPESTRQT